MADSLRLVLMGTGPFAVPSFEAIRRQAAENGDEIVRVYVRPLPPVKSRGGPPPQPVREWAESHGLPVEAPASINDTDTIAELVSHQADLLVVCDYGQILKPEALAAARLGGINLHGSLLPAYRGAAPVQRALLSGDEETGVSVIHMTPKLDGGPIVSVRKTPISSEETSGELEVRLSNLGVEATMESVALLRGIPSLDDHGPLGEVQDPAKVSKAPRLSKAEAEIDWTMTGKQIDCLVRGMQPWPVAFTFAQVKDNKPPIRVAIRKVTPVKSEATNDKPPGSVVEHEEFAIACGDGHVVIERLQPAGKKEMSGLDFARGHRLEPGQMLMVGKS
ncbi:methionyl-tRNA formyltransferase [Rhodopirellula halodulae]|uniref:methionyl-tRNA formyltransferase n=1 Tax=Rhodopirellula halodulae TaxID=2894198 RepID=UPI002108371D